MLKLSSLCDAIATVTVGTPQRLTYFTNYSTDIQNFISLRKKIYETYVDQLLQYSYILFVAIVVTYVATCIVHRILKWPWMDFILLIAEAT